MNMPQLRHDILDSYHDVLSGRLDRFPDYSWTGSDGRHNAIRCTRYLFEILLKWTPEQIKEQVTSKTFADHRLLGMLTRVYGTSPYAALNDAYPGVFKPWELRNSPLFYWTPETAINATRWLIEEKLEWDEDTMKQKITFQTFEAHRMSGMIALIYSGSAKSAVLAAYPHLQGNELVAMKRNFKQDAETNRQLVRDILEHELCWTPEDIRAQFSFQTFRDLKLDAFLNQAYGGSPFLALDAAYPGVYHPWELSKLPRNLRDYDTALAAVRWLLQDRLAWDAETIKANLSYETFTEHGLNGILGKHFGHSPFQALDAVFPGQFHPWELTVVPQRFWTDETVKQAMHWLIDEQLEIPRRLAPYVVKTETLKTYGIAGLIGNQATLQQALDLACSEEDPYTPLDVYRLVVDGDLPAYPPKFVEEHAQLLSTDGLRYVVEERLGWTPDEVRKGFNSKFLETYKLSRLPKFLGCTQFDLLDAAYPDIYKQWEMKSTPNKYWTQDVAITAVRWTLEEKCKLPKEEWTTRVTTEWLVSQKLDRILRYISMRELKQALK